MDIDFHFLESNQVTASTVTSLVPSTNTSGASAMPSLTSSTASTMSCSTESKPVIVSAGSGALDTSLDTAATKTSMATKTITSGSSAMPSTALTMSSSTQSKPGSGSLNAESNPISEIG